MKAKGGFFDVAYGRVYYRFRPTAMDKTGCDGIYVSMVRLSPACKRAMLCLATAMIARVKKSKRRARI